MTKCWRKFYNKFELSSCASPNHVNCGFFCASSKLQCAKVGLQITSSVTLLLGLISGGISLGKSITNAKNDVSMIGELMESSAEDAKLAKMDIIEYIKALNKKSTALAKAEGFSTSTNNLVKNTFIRQQLAQNAELIGASLMSTTLMGIVQILTGETFNCKKFDFSFIFVYCNLF